MCLISRKDINCNDDKICAKCHRWQQLQDQQAGECTKTSEYTAAGASCNDWIGVSEKSQSLRPAFDLYSAIERVCRAKLEAVSIVSVQRLLRCTYTRAAQVVDAMKESGLLK